MKTEMKAVVASLVVIALALTAVSGITYSWFSDEEKATIDVNTANIDISGQFSDANAYEVDSLGSITSTTPQDTKATVNPDDSSNLSIVNLSDKRAITATYTMTNASTVKTTYRMYIQLDSGISTEKFKMNVVTAASSETSGIANGDISFKDGIAYVVGSASEGKTLEAQKGATFTFTIVFDGLVNEDMGKTFSFKIVNEAYQYDYTYTPIAPMASGIATIAQPNDNKGVTVSGTTSAAEGVDPAEVKVEFSAGAVSTITDNGTKNVELKAEMLETTSNLAKISLKLDDGTTTTFGDNNYVTVTLDVAGMVNNVVVSYVGGDEQPTLLSSNYDEVKGITTVVFKTNHFSEFVISDGYYKVSSFDELKTAVEYGISVALAMDVTFTSTITIPNKSIVVDFGSFTVSSNDVLFKMSQSDNEYTLTIDAESNGKITAKRIVNGPSDNTGYTESLIMNGGNYEVSELGIRIYSMKYVELNDVTISSSDNATVWSGNHGATDIVINGGKFTTTGDGHVGIYLGVVRNSATIKNAEITGYTGLEIKSGKTVTVEGCTITGTGVYSEPAAINNNGSGSGVAPVMINNGYCGEPAGITSGTMAVTITGGTIAYADKSTDNPAIVIVEKVGGIDMVVSHNGESIAHENKYTIGKSSFLTNVEKTEVACLDGKTYFTTLEAAFAEVMKDENKAAHTIALVQDCSGNGVVVSSGSKITVNFNGYAYNINGTLVGSRGTETNGFQLLKDSTIVFNGGTITSDKALILIQNYSNLTLDGMKIDGTNASCLYSLSNNNGVTVIKDTTILAKNGVAFDVYANFGAYNGPSVTVEGNSVIEGTIEINSAGDRTPTSVHSLNLKAGTFTGIKVVKLVDSTKVTKSTDVKLDAPTGYEWNSNGELVKKTTD